MNLAQHAMALLGAWSPAPLANLLTPSRGYRFTGGLAYRPGPRGQLDLYEPEGLSAEAPMIVFFYGGGWRWGERGNYRFAAQSLTTLGCAVAVPDYRLGQAGAWPHFLQDGAAALRWLRGNHGAARPLVLMGHSAGAFIALALATDPRWLGGAERGRLAGAVGLAGPYDFQPEKPAYIATFAAAPGGRASAAPADDAALAGTPPALLLHGLKDGTVSPERSRELAARLAMAGRPVRLIEYPRLGHTGIVAALATPLRRLGLAGAPVLEDVGAFLASLRR